MIVDCPTIVAAEKTLEADNVHRPNSDCAMQKVKLAHEPIKSLGWPAMTMDFKVTNSALLDGVKAGDAIIFDLEQGGRPGEWDIARIVPRGVKR